MWNLHPCMVRKHEVNEITVQKLQTFINKCKLTAYMGGWRSDGQKLFPTKGSGRGWVNIEKTVQKRKWNWIGHTLRTPESSITRTALESNGTFRVPGEGDAQSSSGGTTHWRNYLFWTEARKMAKNRVRCRARSTLLLLAHLCWKQISANLSFLFINNPYANQFKLFV